MKKQIIISALAVGSLFIALIFVGNANSNEEASDKQKSLNQDIYAYWKQGKAEITSYELEQVRYGEIRKGKAVMIFVTEPFLPNTQVKYDGIETGEERTEVLKLNFERIFTTGIYPYTLMTSVFTPFNPDPGHPFKITTSSQDWCGHTFFQLNNRRDNFEISSYSYFQQLGDQEIRLPKSHLEDEIWNKIRLDINSLPLGEIEIIPSTKHLRFANLEPKALAAEAELLTDVDEKTGKDIYSYNINYSDYDRILQIYFEKEFPRKILGWKETYKPLIIDGEKKLMTTEARIINSINLDYWNANSNADSVFRSELGL